MDRSAEAGRPPTTTFNVLFVCTGNTCRSPMAEALARQELARRGWRHVELKSAGVAANPGSRATAEACAAMARRGIDLGAHASALLTPTLVDWADVILAMSDSHLHMIGEMGGGEKMTLLEEFAAGEPTVGAGIPDPFGGDEAEYEATAATLEALVGGALDRLAPIIEP